MKAIITRVNPDGTYDEVGMNNRIVFKAKTKRKIRQVARDYVHRNGSVRIEYFHDSLYESPASTEHIHFKQD